MDTPVMLIVLWLGIGAAVGILHILQWMADGCLCHAAGPEGVDRWFYVKGLMADMFALLITGPLVLIYQLICGMPILPTGNPLKGLRKAFRDGVTG